MQSLSHHSNFLALAFGYFLAPKLSLNIRHFIFKILPYFSYILLASVALELTLALDQIEDPSTILPPAIIIALTTSFGSFFTCLFAYSIFDKQSVKGKISYNFCKCFKEYCEGFSCTRCRCFIRRDHYSIHLTYRI